MGMELEEAGVNQLIRPPTALVRFDLDGCLDRQSSVCRPGRESYSSWLIRGRLRISGPALFGKASKTATLKDPRVFYGSSDLMEVEELESRRESSPASCASPTIPWT